MANDESHCLTGCAVLQPMDMEPVPQQRPLAKATKVTGGRFQELNSFVDFTLSNLNRNELAVWIVLFRDTKDGIARTAQSDIARRAGISTRTVIRTLAKLELKGLLQRVHRGGLNRGTNVYRAKPLSAVVTCDRTVSH